MKINYKIFWKLVNILIFIFIIRVNYVYSQQVTEYELKAVYLFNFSNFVYWPNTQIGEFTFGIFQKDKVSDVLEDIIKQKNIEKDIYRIKFLKTTDDIANCNILYISDIKSNDLIKILDKLKNRPILSVGNNIENFCQEGGIINFQLYNAAKPFEINNFAATSSFLKISPKLLRLAEIKNFY